MREELEEFRRAFNYCLENMDNPKGIDWHELNEAIAGRFKFKEPLEEKFEERKQ